MMIKNQLEFQTCLKTEVYCLDIVLLMIDIANITEEEAFQRINSYWGGKDFTSEDDIVFMKARSIGSKPFIMNNGTGGITNKKTLLQEKYNFHVTKTQNGESLGDIYGGNLG